MSAERVNRQPATAIPWDVQMTLWGYALFGTTYGSMLEFAACMAEGKLYQEMAWDRDAAYLNSIERWHGHDRMPVPWEWALPWVTEDRMRQEIPGWHE